MSNKAKYKYKMIIEVNGEKDPMLKITNLLRQEFGFSNCIVRYLTPTAEALINALQHVDDEINELRCDIDRCERNRSDN